MFKHVSKTIFYALAAIIGMLSGILITQVTFAGCNSWTQGGAGGQYCSTRNWTFNQFLSAGSTTSSPSIYKIAVDNEMKEYCDGTWYVLGRTGWITKYNASSVTATNASYFRTCNNTHLYFTDSWHNMYDPNRGINRFEYSTDGP